jgi:hypothetical protein
MSARAGYIVAFGVAAAAFVASRTERGRAVAADAVGAVVNALTPRGIRNNNPGNIEWIADPARRWRGMVGKDGRYGVFDTPANGVRAIGGELRANFRRGENTLQAIFTEWAPPTENNTEAYIRDGEAELGVDRDAPLSSSRIPAITAVIIKHENGVQPYSLADLALWVQA